MIRFNICKTAFFAIRTSSKIKGTHFYNGTQKSLNNLQSNNKIINTQKVATTKQQQNIPSTLPTLDLNPEPIRLQLLLSNQALNKCSPLMRSILANVASKGALANPSPPKLIQENNLYPQRTPLQYNNHNLQQFRHMLAGPLPNQASLDKFCVKKVCPLVVEIKYDGERTLISFDRNRGVEMTSRNGKPQNHTFRSLREQIQQQLLATDLQSIKVDGEIMALDRKTLTPLSFSQLMKHKKIKEVQLIEEQEQSDKIFLVYIFDVLERNGENLLQTELLHRRQFIPSIQAFKLVEYRIINYPEERAKIFEFFNEALQRKYEGLMIKGVRDKYYTNDSRIYWKKIKRGFMSSKKDPNISQIQLDLIVMGARRGIGTNNRQVYASFLLGTEYGGSVVPISFVGSGFTSDFLESVTDQIKDLKLQVQGVPSNYDMGRLKVDALFRPALVFEVHAQEFTVSSLHKLGDTGFGGLSLRFPIFKRVRTDKGVKEATKGEEILQLSKNFNLNLPE